MIVVVIETSPAHYQNKNETKVKPACGDKCRKEKTTNVIYEYINAEQIGEIEIDELVKLICGDTSKEVVS